MFINIPMVKLMPKDRDIYNHFEARWMSTEDFVKARTTRQKVIDILIGILVSFGLFTCSLVILVGLLG